MSKKKEALIYVTAKIKAGAVSLAVGVLFTPVLYLISDKSLVFWFYLMFLLCISIFLGKQDARCRYALLKRHIKDYGEIGSFWIQNRFEVFMPKNSLKFLYYSFRACFVFGEWRCLSLSLGAYLFLIMLPLYLHIIQIRPGFSFIFVVLLLCEVMSFHLFFLFLHWKYKIAMRIKEEYGLDYTTLISVD